jgi:hypothetical protein
MMKIDTILLILCVISIISIVVYVLTSKVEKFSFFDQMKRAGEQMKQSVAQAQAQPQAPTFFDQMKQAGEQMKQSVAQAQAQPQAPTFFDQMKQAGEQIKQSVAQAQAQPQAPNSSINLIDTSDNNPLISGIKNMKSGLDKLGDFVKMLDGGAQKVLEDIKNAFDPKTADLRPCPSNSKENELGDCMAEGGAHMREDGNNIGEAINIFNTGYRGGCSWNRHVEGILCFRDCKPGYFGRATEGCFANGANEFGVMRYKRDRWQCPPPNNTTHTKIDNVTKLCYKP